jgi:hypothetical protein
VQLLNELQQMRDKMQQMQKALPVQHQQQQQHSSHEAVWSDHVPGRAGLTSAAPVLQVLNHFEDIAVF